MPEGERRLDQRSADAVGTGGLVHHCVVERLCGRSSPGLSATGCRKVPVKEDETRLPPFLVTQAAIDQLVAVGGTVRVDIEPGGCSGHRLGCSHRICLRKETRPSVAQAPYSQSALPRCSRWRARACTTERDSSLRATGSSRPPMTRVPVGVPSVRRGPAAGRQTAERRHPCPGASLEPHAYLWDGWGRRSQLALMVRHSTGRDVRVRATHISHAWAPWWGVSPAERVRPGHRTPRRPMTLRTPRSTARHQPGRLRHRRKVLRLPSPSSR